jgi:hypothetical protein
MFPASGNHWPLGVALCKVPVMMNSKPIVKEPVRRIVVTGGAGFLERRILRLSRGGFHSG